MTRKGIETTVGIFLLVGIAAMIWLALKVGNWSPTTSNDYELTAKFDNIGGLTIKAPVTLAGVTIGRVVFVGIDTDDYRAKVTLQIDQTHDYLPIDSSAAILTSGLLGAQYIGLDPGVEETYLEDGDQIEITQPAIVLEHLIGQIFMRTAEEQNR